jgi:hypothetical protein
MKIFRSVSGKQDPWVRCFCEMIATAILVFAGLSLIIFMFGWGSPVVRILTDI